MTVCFVITLDPAKCSNPDADLRYLIPNQLVAQAPGVIQDDGYDYAPGTNNLLIYLRSDDRDAASRVISDFIRGAVVLGNPLRDCATFAETPN